MVTTMKKIHTAKAVAFAVMLFPAVSVAESSALGAPSNLNAVAVSADEVSLSWYDNSVSERGFLVERSEDGINWETVAEVAPDSGEYRDVNLAAGTRYQYRVTSFNSLANSGSSNTDTVVTPPLMDFQLDSGHFQVGAAFGSD